jgi:hypothetical protein
MNIHQYNYKNKKKPSILDKIRVIAPLHPEHDMPTLNEITFVILFYTFIVSRCGVCNWSCVNY